MEQRRQKFNGVILKKLETFDTTLERMREYLPVDYEKLSRDWGLQKIIERSLQILVEIMIDISQRIISLKGNPPPSTAAGTISRLKEYGIISDHRVYVQMVKFRNFLVHNYDSLDTEILYQIITRNLDDFTRFRDEILRHGTL